jgi:hypothetical protein
MSGGSSSSSAVGPNLFTYLTVPSTYSDALGAVAPVGAGNATELPVCTGLYHSGCYFPGGVTERNQFYGPGYWNIDLVLAKQFKITERVNLQFRGELYNAFNHHNLYLLTANGAVDTMASLTDQYGNPIAPQIQAKRGGYGDANDERRNVQFGLKLIF